MLFVLLILIVLAALAGPAFTTMIGNQNVKSAGSSLYAALVRTRSEAITRNSNVTLTPATGGWKNGWQIVDANSNVLESQVSSTDMTVSGPASVVYSRYGRISGGSVPVFVFTSPRSSTAVQCLSVDLSGRPYTKKASSC
jgi:type IV fimbrial biogenesis protein FimT